MLRQPKSAYEKNTIFKVKSSRDTEVKYLEPYPQTCGLRCEMPNGKECVIRCPFDIFVDPPTIGSVITVNCHGFYTSGRPRVPSFVRARTDITWEEVVRQEKEKLALLKEAAPKE